MDVAMPTRAEGPVVEEDVGPGWFKLSKSVGWHILTTGVTSKEHRRVLVVVVERVPLPVPQTMV